MARDRIFTSNQYRSAIDELKSSDVLGLDIVEGKEIFMLAVALGMAEPTPLKNRVGLFLNTALKTADKALMASVLLGTAISDEQLDEYADFDACADLCEQCAEAGYSMLVKKYNDADCDEELLERRLINELKVLYMANVEADL